MSRAQTVRDYLIERGVPGAPIYVAGLGEANPFTSDCLPEEVRQRYGVCRMTAGSPSKLWVKSVECAVVQRVSGNETS
ncbi:OmpA family protein [Caballeronia udeis]|uniref:OmpA family protein n=1 Tax=Caballeronia udeis TaxID=1232866 RepID=UPI00384BE0A0